MAELTVEQQRALARARAKARMEADRAGMTHSYTQERGPQPDAFDWEYDPYTGEMKPDNMFLNPETGQMTARDLLRNAGEADAGRAVIGGTGQGLSLGHLDETMGAIGYVEGGSDMANFRREQARAIMERDQGEYGAEFMLGELAGAGATGLATAPSFAGRAPLSAAGRGSAVGGAEAGVYGFGTGEGGAKERVLNALTTVPYGAIAGASAPFLGEAARRGGSAVAGPVVALAARGAPNEAKAARFVGKTVARSGKSERELADEIAAAAAEGQPGFMLADALGRRGQRALSGVTRQPSDVQNEVVDYLSKRQNEQGDRLSNFLAEGFDASDTAAQREAKLVAARKAAADKEYASARQDAGPVNLNGTLAVLDGALRRDPILGETALSQGPMGRRLQGLRDRLENEGEQLIAFDEVLGVKQDLWNTLQRNPNAGQEMWEAYRALDGALEAASPSYRAANDNFRRASQAIDAIAAGQAASGSRVRSADVADRFANMSPEEQAQFRTGYGDSVIGRAEAAAPGNDKSRPLTTGKVQGDIDTLALNPELLKRRIERENIMFETRRQATGGSQTADNLADAADASGANVVGMVADAATTGGAVTVARGLARNLGNMATGTNDATTRLIAEALMSRDPAAALQPAIRQAMKDQRKARIIEGLLRSGGIRLSSPAG